jgi:hypothetical protein
MNILSFLRKFLPSANESPAQTGLAMQVRCDKCGEILPLRVHLMNDLSVEYDAQGGVSDYICRKVAMGKGMCFQQAVIELKFDSNRRLISHKIQGGALVGE